MGIGFLRLSLPQQGPTHRGPVRFLAISMSAFLGQPAPSQSHLSPRRVATLVLPPAACAGRPPCMRRHSRCVSEAVPPPHRWLFSLERGRRSCSEPLRCAPAEPLSDARSRSERLPVIPYPRACLPPTSCSPLDRPQRLRPAAPSTSGSPALLSNPAVVPRPFRFTGPCLSLRMPQRSHQRGSLS